MSQIDLETTLQLFVIIMPPRNSKRKGKTSRPNQNYGPTRLPEEAGELLGVVSRLMGGPHIQVMCSDGSERLCVIRRKFRGRHKRGNEVSSGTLVLVGLYEWSSGSGARGPQGDLLHVYSRDQTRSFSKKGILSAHLNNLVAAAGDTQAAESVDAGLVFAADLPPTSDDEMQFESGGSESEEDDEQVTTSTGAIVVAGDDVDLADI